MTYGSLFTGVGCFDIALDTLGFLPAWQCERDKTCQSVLARHWPNVRRIDDVLRARIFTERKHAERIASAELVRPDLICGGFPCFPAGTLVLCKDKLKSIEDVSVGDEVLTHLGRYCRVARTMKRRAETWELRGHGHPALRTTPDHRLWSSKRSRLYDSSWRGWNAHFEDPRWVAAGEMQGRHWCSPTSFPEIGIPQIESVGRESAAPPLSKEMFWLIGAWLGDGWAHVDARRGCVFICAGYHEADELASRIEDAGLTVRSSDEPTTVKFRIMNRALANWLIAQFGSGACGKHIPSWALGTDNATRTALLDGYRFADGSDWREGFRITTVSKRLAISARLLGLSLGWSVALHRYAPSREACVIEGRTVSEKPQWQLVFAKNARSAFDIGKHRYGRVRESRPTDEIEEVYDIEVDGDHSFLADGIVAHNCQDLSVAGKRAGLAGGRSGLFWTMRRIIANLRPRWFLLENVPGLLSSNQGRDMGAIVGALGDMGYGWAYRVLDAQWFGLAQRRKRVFIVGYLGIGSGMAGRPTIDDVATFSRISAAVLFEQDRMPWDHPTRGEARTRTARGAAGGVNCGEPRGVGYTVHGSDDCVKVMSESEIAQSLRSRSPGQIENSSTTVVATHTRTHTHTHTQNDLARALTQGGRFDGDTEDFVTHTLKAEGADASEDGTGRGVPLVAGTLSHNGKAAGSATQQDAEYGMLVPDQIAAPLRSRQHSDGTSMPGRGGEDDENLIVFDERNITSGENRSKVEAGRECHTLHEVPPTIAFQSKQSSTAKQPRFDDVAPTLDVAKAGGTAVAFNIHSQNSCAMKGNGDAEAALQTDVSRALDSAGFTPSQGGTVIASGPIPLDMRQASRGGKMTNKRKKGSTGGAPGTGIGKEGDPSPTLADSHTPAIAFQCQGSNVGEMGTLRAGNGNESGGVPFMVESFQESQSGTRTGETHATLDSNNGSRRMHGAIAASGVRRLTPTECERLQGLPDGWTALGADGEEISDSARYRMIGNGAAVPVIEWILQRLLDADATL